MRQLLPDTYLRKWELEHLRKELLQEIRLRAGKELMITYEGMEQVLDEHLVSKADIEQIFQWLCGYGVYAYQEEIAKGYITIQGGHRVGIGGQVLFDLYGKVNHMKYISSLLIRVSHDIGDVCDGTLDKLYRGGKVQSTLILAPPGCGKTTFLRDLVRKVSDGNALGTGQNISLVDEREELAAVCMGIPTINVGKRTDVISGCEKSIAMEMCLRSLGPEVVAVDEIYSEKDLEAIKRLDGCGCAILATHHAYTFEEFSRKYFGKEVQKYGLFERYVLLGRENGSYVVRGVLDAEGEVLM